MDTSEPEQKKAKKSYAEAIKSTDSDEILQAMLAGYATPDKEGLAGNGSGGAHGTGSHPPAQTQDCPTPMSNAMRQQGRETLMVSDGYQQQLHNLQQNLTGQGQQQAATPLSRSLQMVNGAYPQLGQQQIQPQVQAQSPAQMGGSPMLSEATLSSAISIALRACGLNCGPLNNLGGGGL